MSCGDQLEGGAACSFASQVHQLRETIDFQQWNERTMVYTKGPDVIWYVSVGISIAVLVGVVGEKNRN
jgi:hypothetical protein